VGEEGVGRRASSNRFVSGAFDESYIRTLGLSSRRKSVASDRCKAARFQVRHDDPDTWVSGPSSSCSRRRTPRREGVLAVFDTTRAASSEIVEVDRRRRDSSPDPVYALATGPPHPPTEVTPEDGRTSFVIRVSDPLHVAKTGDNVEVAFQGLAKTIVESSHPVTVEAFRRRNHLIGTGV